MKDALPRLFRSLETNAGREGFDTIVVAAAATYAALRHPTEAQARDFGRLAVPVWSMISPETRRAVAAALCHCPRVPRAIVERLLAAPIEISAPFLLSSPCLTEADLATMAIEGDGRLSQIVERRRAAGTRTSVPPAPDVAPDAPRANEAKPKIEAEPPPQAETPAVSAAPPAPEPKAVGEAREALRRLVQPGRRPAGTVTDVGDLVALARAGEARAAYDGLAAMLALPRERLAAIELEPQGTLLAAALRVLRAGEADALTIAMLLKPAIGRDVAAFQALKDDYRRLHPDECRAALGLPRSPEPPAPSLAPRLSDLERPLRPEPRRQFGRRPEDKRDNGSAKRA